MEEFFLLRSLIERYFFILIVPFIHFSDVLFTQSNDPIFYEEFDEVHYGLWAKVLTDEEYQEIVDAVTKNE